LQRNYIGNGAGYDQATTVIVLQEVAYALSVGTKIVWVQTNLKGRTKLKKQIQLLASLPMKAYQLYNIWFLIIRAGQIYDQSRG